MTLGAWSSTKPDLAIPSREIHVFNLRTAILLCSSKSVGLGGDEKIASLKASKLDWQGRDISRGELEMAQTKGEGERHDHRANVEGSGLNIKGTAGKLSWTIAQTNTLPLSIAKA